MADILFRHPRRSTLNGLERFWSRAPHDGVARAEHLTLAVHLLLPSCPPHDAVVRAGQLALTLHRLLPSRPPHNGVVRADHFTPAVHRFLLVTMSLSLTSPRLRCSEFQRRSSCAASLCLLSIILVSAGSGTSLSMPRLRQTGYPLQAKPTHDPRIATHARITSWRILFGVTTRGIVTASPRATARGHSDAHRSFAGGRCRSASCEDREKV